MANITTFNGGGGSFIKPKELEGAKAILVEVTKFERQIPTDFGPKDQATADLTVFNTDASLEAGVPDQTLSNVKMQQTALARDLQNYVGQAVVVSLGTGNAKPGRQAPWIWVPVPADVQQKVADYAKERDAELDEAPI